LADAPGELYARKAAGPIAALERDQPERRIAGGGVYQRRVSGRGFTQPPHRRVVRNVSAADLRGGRAPDAGCIVMGI
jgi:hypothetical protein